MLGTRLEISRIPVAYRIHVAPAIWIMSHLARLGVKARTWDLTCS